PISFLVVVLWVPFPALWNSRWQQQARNPYIYSIKTAGVRVGPIYKGLKVHEQQKTCNQRLFCCSCQPSLDQRSKWGWFRSPARVSPQGDSCLGIVIGTSGW